MASWASSISVQIAGALRMRQRREKWLALVDGRAGPEFDGIERTNLSLAQIAST
jgi:hypothetical protein